MLGKSKASDQFGTLTVQHQDAESISDLDHSRRKTSLVSNVFFLLSGVSCVLVVNCFLSMEQYWTSRYGANTLNVLLFGINVGGFIGFFAYPYLAIKISTAGLSIFSPLFLLVCSFLAILIGEVIEGPNLVKSVFCVMNGICVGIIGTFLQCCFTSLSFKYGKKEISIFDGGFALCGILTTLIAMANLIFFKDSSTFMQTVYYCIFQLIATCVIILVSVVYFDNYPEDKFVESLNQKEGENIRPAPEDTLSDGPSLTSTFKLIYPLLFSMGFNFAVTMSMCPVILFGLGMGWENVSMGQQVTLIVFNSSDFVGKLSYAWLPLTDTLANHLLALAKIVFPAISTLSLASFSNDELRDKAAVTLSMSAALGLMHGYLNSSIFHLASVRVKKRHRNNASYLSVLAIMIGFLYGSVCNLFGVTQ